MVICLYDRAEQEYSTDKKCCHRDIEGVGIMSVASSTITIVCQPRCKYRGQKNVGLLIFSE